MSDLVDTLHQLHTRISRLEAHIGAPGDRMGQYAGVVYEFNDRYSGNNPDHKFKILDSNGNTSIRVMAKHQYSTQLYVTLTPHPRVARFLNLNGSKNGFPVLELHGKTCEKMAEMLDNMIV
jgi:hypothetical protein